MDSVWQYLGTIGALADKSTDRRNVVPLVHSMSLVKRVQAFT